MPKVNSRITALTIQMQPLIGLYWTLLGNWGVHLKDIKSDGTNTAEIEKANEAQYKQWSHRIHDELLRRAKSAAQ